MTPSSGSLRSVLGAALIAGLVAGAVTAAFHGLLTEPVIDRAIALEAQRGPGHPAPGGHAAEPVVSRRGQKIGLVVGLLVYGATWGLVVGLALHLTRPWSPRSWSQARRGLLAAALIGWSAAVFPFLKYPASPPGVGEAETIALRQLLYVGFILLAGLGLGAALALRRRLAVPGAGVARRLAPAAFYAVWAVGLYVLMPDNPDPVRLPGAVVRAFRLLSLAGLLVFWGALGATLAGLSRGGGGSRVAVRLPVASGSA